MPATPPIRSSNKSCACLLSHPPPPGCLSQHPCPRRTDVGTGRQGNPGGQGNQAGLAKLAVLLAFKGAASDVQFLEIRAFTKSTFLPRMASGWTPSRGPQVPQVSVPICWSYLNSHSATCWGEARRSPPTVLSPDNSSGGEQTQPCGGVRGHPDRRTPGLGASRRTGG